MSETRNYLSLTIKLILVISIFNSIQNQFWHIMSTNIFLLILMFIPQLTKKYKIKIPKSFEWALFIFVFLTLFLGKISGIIAPIIFGIAVGFIGLIMLAILYSSNQIKKNYFLIILFSFNFALAFSVMLELLKYYIKKAIGQEITSGIYAYSMQNITFVIIGALIALTIGFCYMKGYSGIIGKIIHKVIISNPKLFKKENSEKEILELIKKGESQKLEFKETLRYNIYTNEPDKKIEYSTLKTIVSFMNSEGGELLLGIKDNGEISGIEKDKFENTDKFLLHLTNILKQKVGKKHLDLIKTSIIKIKEKTIILIECKRSPKQIFLRNQQNQEEFYIRTGNSTNQISGSELIDYVKRRFSKIK